MSKCTFTADDLRYLRTWVAAHTGVSIREDQQYLLETRLEPVAARHNLTPGELTAAVKAGLQPLSTTVLDAALNNETSWFRDPAAFDTLRNHILPQLIEANRDTRRLSIWSAASSSGQELYSVGMLLSEQFPDVFSSWDLQLVGTDISSSMVAKARAGRYTQAEVSRGLPARLLVQYLERDRLDWVVSHTLRTKVHFEQRSVLAHQPSGPFDLVLCRYLLIYFDEPTKQRAIRQLHDSIQPHGTLLLGGSEMFIPQTRQFTAKTLDRTTIYLPT
jgi:chemotaxis protein methyltransferase CheR